MEESPNTIQPLPFEEPLFEMEAKIAELEELSQSTGMDLNGQMLPLKEKLRELTIRTFAALSPWDRVKLARHKARPFTSDYIDLIVEEFTELHGDRSFRDDPAMVCGLGRISGRAVLLIGHRKGRDLKERIACNFGCAHPEGYRKAMRCMRLAEKFGIPVVTFINTPGAYPGIGAEERGQAYAIAESLMLMAGLRVPIISIVIGEGGSGGALGIGMGDGVFILEHAYYSVISPEGCAAILWKSADKAEDAAAALKLTATDLSKLGVVDRIVPEPLGGAHRNPGEMAETLRNLITQELDRLVALEPEKLLDARYDKFRAIGSLFADGPPSPPPPTADVETDEASSDSETS